MQAYFLTREMTPRRREAIARHKRKMAHEARMAALPPLTEDEARRLVWKRIALHGVTICLPAASPDCPPQNAGARWRQ